MPLLCPICKSTAQELARTGDGTGFYCTSHGHFKIGDRSLLDEYYTRAEWVQRSTSADVAQWRASTKIASSIRSACATPNIAKPPHIMPTARWKGNGLLLGEGTSSDSREFLGGSRTIGSSRNQTSPDGTKQIIRYQSPSGPPCSRYQTSGAVQAAET
jgi:hypothetical protein